MAVYTEVADDELDAFMAPYGLGEVTSCKGIAEGVENSNFLVTTTTGPYILTLYEKRVAEADLPFFIGLMQHLHDKGISCPLPVPTEDGETLRKLAGRPACLITFLEGMWPRQVSPGHCREVGAAMARMHIAGKDFAMRRDNNLSLDGWAGLVAECRDGADSITPGLSQIITDELAALKAAWPADLSTGVIHADLFPDNVFFDREGKLSGLIDFYFACNDILAYDIAICLNAWCFETDGSFNITKAKRLLEGYASVRPLSHAEIAALPVLARGSALRFLLTRAYDWLNHEAGAFVQPKDPTDYLTRLKFHQQVAGPEDYGLDMPARKTPDTMGETTCRT